MRTSATRSLSSSRTSRRRSTSSDSFRTCCELTRAPLMKRWSLLCRHSLHTIYAFSTILHMSIHKKLFVTVSVFIQTVYFKICLFTFHSLPHFTYNTYVPLWNPVSPFSCTYAQCFMILCMYVSFPLLHGLR